MIAIPAVDLRDGACVQLVGGSSATPVPENTNTATTIATIPLLIPLAPSVV